MHKTGCVWLLGTLAVLAPPLSATAESPATAYRPTPETLVQCTVCHGVDLKGNRAVAAPALSGLAQWYVERQLRAFADGTRGRHDEDLAGLEMQPVAAALTDEQVRAAATFIATEPPRQVQPTVRGNVDAGRRLYRQCAACHGQNGEGSEALHSPRLAGQSDWYLITQMQNYRAGVRGYLQEDTWGTQMRTAAQLLNDADTHDVVAYINTLE